MKEISLILDLLAAGRYDGILTKLYCRPAEELQPFRERIRHVLDGYCRIFGKEKSAEASVFSAPGRTEICGNHTDHQRGKVLTGAVDLDAISCAAPNGTPNVRIYSEGYGLIEFDILHLEPVASERNTTTAIVRGIIAGILSKGYQAGGFDAYVISDVPGGSGLSSSACFEILTGIMVNGLFCGNSLEMEEIAKIGQLAENVYFGKPSGLMDQMGCALGGVVAIDFYDKENPGYTSIDSDFRAAGYALCIIDTGADHADLTEDYAAVPREMRLVAEFFGKEVLCEVDVNAFYTAVPELRERAGDRAVLRAYHYFTDCERVEKQAEALMRGDYEMFFQLVNDSGQSSYMYLQNVDTYRNPAREPVSVALAMAEHYLDNRGAKRVHGGGFAGTIQAFVPLDILASFQKEMNMLLGDGACKVVYIRPIGGCVLIE